MGEVLRPQYRSKAFNVPFASITMSQKIRVDMDSLLTSNSMYNYVRRDVLCTAPSSKDLRIVLSPSGHGTSKTKQTGSLPLSWEGRNTGMIPECLEKTTTSTGQLSLR